MATGTRHSIAGSCASARREVVLQRRALGKDTFAGCWDAAAAGHWRFGETPAEAAREIAEELGLDVRSPTWSIAGASAMARRFREWPDRPRASPGLRARLRRPPLGDYRPDPREVSRPGGVSLPTTCLALLGGRLARIVATRSRVGVGIDGQAGLGSKWSLGRTTWCRIRLARLRRILGSRFDGVDTIVGLWLKATRTRRPPSAPGSRKSLGAQLTDHLCASPSCPTPGRPHHPVKELYPGGDAAPRRRTLFYHKACGPKLS